MDTGQEHLHYITDITATEDLFILVATAVELSGTGGTGANGGGGAGGVDDAGIEDMVQLANSQLQQQQVTYEAARIKNPSPSSPTAEMPMDSFLIASNVKRFAFIEHIDL